MELSDFQQTLKLPSPFTRRNFARSQQLKSGQKASTGSPEVGQSNLSLKAS